jgi:large subunit ribosomal protein L5
MAEEKKTVAAKATPKKEAAPKAAPKKAAAPKAEVKAESQSRRCPEGRSPEGRSESRCPESRSEESPETPSEEHYENRLIKKYKSEVVPPLVKKFGYTSVMQRPKLEKIVINIGVGDATQNAKALEDSVAELATITGQHPVTTKAKKSIATFKVRQGSGIGCKVTLRGLRMYEFFDKLVSALRSRASAISAASARTPSTAMATTPLGVKEQLIFPEIDYDKVSKIRGMDIVIVTTAGSDEEAYSFLQLMGMPFRK